jgi:hypothetical protein
MSIPCEYKSFGCRVEIHFKDKEMVSYRYLAHLFLQITDGKLVYCMYTVPHIQVLCTSSVTVHCGSDASPA